MIARTDFSWPPESLDDAIATLARAAGLSPRADVAPRPPEGLEGDVRTRDAWIEATASFLGVEAEPVECTYADLEGSLRTMSPFLLRVSYPAGPRYLAVVGATRGEIVVLTPKLARARIATAEVHAALTAHLELDFAARVDMWLDVAKVTGSREKRARRALFGHFLAERRVGDMWLLRADPGSSFARGLAHGGSRRRAGLIVVVALAQTAMTMLSWLIVGRAALSADVRGSWLVTWILVSLSAVPLQLAGAHLAGRLTVDVAAAMKQRLLCGALRMDPDAIRRRGSGLLLGMVSESTAVETVGLTGAVGSLLAFAQLAGAAVALAMGAGGALHVAILAAWCALTGWLTVRLHRRRAAWTARRLGLTGSFVENVVANRTRVVQQPASGWHRIEDELTSAYVGASREADGAGRTLAVLPARGWLIVGFLGLVPALLVPQTDTIRLAIAIGGILQAQAALGALVNVATSLIGAHVAWRSIRDLFRAAADLPAAGTPHAEALGKPSAGAVVLDVRGVSFRYPDGEQVLRSCSLTVHADERVLVEGSSGGGKSTLAQVLTGMRAAQNGHVLLRGLDRATLGDGRWRRRVASAPQFHENHVLSASLSFNLLMGRAWPPAPGDRREAEAVCRELGLGPLIDRMPSGLDQSVGETGWQLSHGERSRVFLARALLQRSELVVLDETFGALDPLTLEQCLDVVRRRAPALVVIAHP